MEITSRLLTHISRHFSNLDILSVKICQGSKKHFKLAKILRTKINYKKIVEMTLTGHFTHSYMKWATTADCEAAMGTG